MSTGENPDRHGGPDRPVPVARITTAREPHSVDLNRRMRNYAISMGIRTACVVLFALNIYGTRWFFVAGAVFLPYVAVLLANAGRERVPDRSAAMVAAPDPRAIGPGGRPS